MRQIGDRTAREIKKALEAQETLQKETRDTGVETRGWVYEHRFSCWGGGGGGVGSIFCWVWGVVGGGGGGGG